MFRPKHKQAQQSLWIPAAEVVASPLQLFYDRLDSTLAKAGFHEHARTLCAPSYDSSGTGRPGIDPVVYFKMLIIGFYEGIESERGIASRCADSLAARHFLRYELSEATPDHSSLSRIRQRLPQEVFDEIFAFVLSALNQHGLARGKKVGVDTSVIEANASMRSLVDKLSGTAYRDYVKQLAREAGIDPEDEAAVTRFDRKRPKKTSNDEWHNPHDMEAKIGRTKQGTTKLIYKPEHMVDLETGAILDVEVLAGDHGDSMNLAPRVLEAEERMVTALSGAAEGADMDEAPTTESALIESALIETIVTDKGYYDTVEITDLQRSGIETVIPSRSAPAKKAASPEGQHTPNGAPNGRASGRSGSLLSETERRASEAASGAVRSEAGKTLLRKRGELVERSFQHSLDCGGGRRTTLRGYTNNVKRHLIRAACVNLSLLMRKLYGIGTAKQTVAASAAAIASFFASMWAFVAVSERPHDHRGAARPLRAVSA